MISIVNPGRWTNKKHTLMFGALMIALALFAPAAHAAYISGVSATTTMTAYNGYSIQNTVNGAGLSSNSLSATHAAESPPNSFAASTTTGTITFALGQSGSVAGFSFWNGNNTPNTGINGVTIQYSTDGTTFTNVPGAPATLDKASGTAPFAPQVVSFPAITASHIRFNVLSNHGFIGTTVFAEIAFNDAATTATYGYLTGVSATTTMTPQFDSSLVNAVNGAGLSSNSLSATHVAETPDNSFVGSGTTGVISFNLGQSVSVAGFSFWNGNGQTDAGINGVTIQYSADGTTFTNVPGAPATLARTSGTAPYAPQVVSFPAITASYIRFNVLSNHGFTGGVTAFAEIAFNAASSTSPQSGYLTGVSVTSNLTSADSNSNLQNTVNGAGLSAPDLSATHAATSNTNAWIGNGANGIFTFNLGQSLSVSGFSFWTLGGSYYPPSAGINGVTVQSSTDGTNFTTIPGAPTSFIGPTNGQTFAPQTFSFAPVTATHIRFLALSNFGGNYIGFSEVAFNAGAPAPTYSFTVTKLADTNDGVCSAADCSLREAIGAANAQAGADTIGFAPGLTGIISLGTQLLIDSEIAITGPTSAPGIMLDGQNTSRIARITSAQSAQLAVTFTNLTLANGNATGVGGTGTNGGAIYSYNVDPANPSNTHYTAVGHALSFQNCTFVNNRASNGGGIGQIGGTLALQNCTLVGNLAYNFGGALLADTTAATIRNCTFSDNSGSASHIYQYPSGVNLFNSILANSSTAPFNGVLATNDHNIIGGTAAAAGLETDTNGAAFLKPNSGATPTVALLAGGAAVNGGNNAAVPAGITTDQRGSARIVGSTVDIGAYELAAAVNSAPIAVNDNYTATEDQTLTVSTGGVLANDTDAENNTLTAIKFSDPTHGSVALNTNGTFTYTPVANYNGPDSFSYKANDGSLSSAAATVSISVTAVNDAPVAIPDSYAVRFNLPRVINAPGILINDTDVDTVSLAVADADPNTTAIDPISGPIHGTLLLNGDGSFTYTPNADYVGVDVFSYKTTDGTDLSEATDVLLNVLANTAPVAAADSATTTEDNAVEIDVIANDSDIEKANADLVVEPGSITGEKGGAAVLLPDNRTVRFTPAPNANGGNTAGGFGFSYKASDGNTASATAAVTITVTAVNDAPTLTTNGGLTADEDSTDNVIDDTKLQVEDNDNTPAQLTFTLTKLPEHGTLFNGATALGLQDTFTQANIIAGAIKYSHDGGEATSDLFKFTVSDGVGSSLPETNFAILITPINDAPTTSGLAAVSVIEDAPNSVIALRPSFNDAEDGRDLVYTQTHTNAALFASVSIDDATDTLTLDYAPGAGGTSVITIRATDSGNKFVESTLSVTVDAVDNAPQNTVPGAQLTDEDDALTFALTSTPANAISVSDSDSPSLSVTLSSTNGTLTLSRTTDLAFTNGDGTSDATMTFAGSPANINAALEGLVFVPATNFNGGATLTLTSSDGTTVNDDSDAVSITVTPVNDAPVALDGAATTGEGSTGVTVDLSVLSSDVETAAANLSYTIVTPPTAAQGALSGAGATRTFVPAANFNGIATFTYTVTDTGDPAGTPANAATSAIKTITLTVTSVNDAPTATNETLSPIAENSGARTIAFTALTDNDTSGPTNESGQTLTITAVSNAVGGTVTIQGSTVVFTPTANFNGAASFVYTVQDNGTTNGVDDFKTATATVSFEITSVNEAPIANAIADFTIPQNLLRTLVLSGFDADGDALSYSITALPSVGALYDGAGTTTPITTVPYEVQDAGHRVTFQSGAAGSGSFGFNVSDGTVASATRTVNYTVLDIAPPTITIANPVNNATVSALPTINGTTFDNVGVDRVELFLQRKSDNLFWNGTSWISQPTPISTVLSGSNWSRTAGLPAGVNLAPGAYFVAARAYDARNNGTSATANFTVAAATDTTRPTIAITNPANNASIASLSSVSGTATDNVGVARVDLYLHRNSDNTFWNGTAWVAQPTPLPTVLSGNTWSKTSGLPSGAALLSGAYFVGAAAYDAAGNNAGTPTTNFTVAAAAPDTTPPTIAITTPANNATSASLASVNGTATDNVGVTRVDLFLHRNSDNTFWNGTAWTPAVTPIPTVLSGTNWSRTSGLPTGANLTTGAYFVGAVAYDAAGNNTGTPTTNFTINAVADTTPPTIAITTPANNATVGGLSSINGTTFDNIGVDRVELFLQRKSDNLFWNGTSWISQPTPISTVLSGSNWSRTAGLPAGVNLVSGAYFVAARAYDAANNGTSATANFTVAAATDTTRPTIAITNPANNASIASLSSVSGTATDNVGVARVDLYLHRNSDNTFWNGTAWVAQPTPLSTVLSGNTWSKASGFPSGAALLSGAYFVGAAAYDAAGNNAGTPTTNFTVAAAAPDTTPPTIAITTPANNATSASLASVNGTATDNVGVTRVDLFLHRNSDNTFWNGTAWTPAVTPIPTVLSGTNWSRTSGLPTGANLTTGAYFVRARAYDAANNGTSMPPVNFNIIADTTPPTITIATPANNTTVFALPSISGSANDNNAVDRVELFLQRKSDNFFWNGTAWSAQATPISTVLSGTNWSRTSGLPTGANLATGAYFVAARAYDGRNNGTSATANFNVAIDSTPPTIAFTTPLNNSRLGGLPAIKGVANDNGVVVRVDLFLQRRTDGKFWNGTTWIAQAVPISAVLSGNTWSRTAGLPSGANLTSGPYFAAARAFDEANNATSATTNFFIDPAFPTVVISSPVLNSTVSSFASASGTASISNGAVVTRVSVYLRRNADNLWWNGNGWTPNAAPLPTTISTPSSQVNWNISGPLPRDANLLNGSYFLGVVALTNTGRNGDTNGSFTLQRLAAAGAPSNIQLSSASAKSDGTINLTFTGALSATATDATNYGVLQNGAKLPVQNAQQPSASEVVLNCDSLKHGARVAVNFDLQDARGRTVSGTATVTVK